MKSFKCPNKNLLKTRTSASSEAKYKEVRVSHSKQVRKALLKFDLWNFNKISTGCCVLNPFADETY